MIDVAATVTVLIGNSDNKLTQADWARFCTDLHDAVKPHGIHFAGGSPCDAHWQNYAIVIEMPEREIGFLTHRLRELADRYRQDSIAIAAGKVTFIATASSSDVDSPN